MDALTTAAASGMRSRIESLDVLANNIANSAASGFKADREFYGLYMSAEAANSPAGTGPATLPVVERQWTDFSQGSLSSTGSPLDLALAGKGFFAVTSPAGTLYTRDGSMRMSKNGQIETQDGFTLRAQDGKPIQVDPSKAVDIGTDGIVRQDGLEVAHISVVDVKDPNALSKKGRNYFELLSQDVPKPAAQTEVQQGRLEAANFQAAESAVRLVNVMRQFESLQKAMAIGADMNRHLIDDVAKVGQ
ncbi:MAG: flagellar hook-basal body protein [Bryobacteraceae bacterium]